MEFGRDVFISYSSKDREWATRLYADLTADGVKVFLDARDLESGKEWDPALKAELANSRHLVALWSGHAKESEWVAKELARFEQSAESASNRRRLICLNLQGANPAYSIYQSISDIAAGGAYPGSPDAVPGLWADVVRKIKNSIDVDDMRIPIAVSVLTLTLSQLEVSFPNGLSPGDLAAIKAEADLDLAALQARYGNDMLDWRPYGAAETMRMLLDTLTSDLNRGVGSSRFRWDAVGEELWAGDPALQNVAANALRNAPLSLVVVDVLALRQRDVLQRCMILREYLKKETVAWVMVPPHASDARLLRYREIVKQWSKPLLDTYLDPPLPDREISPHFGIYCGDQGEIRRVLRKAVGRYLAVADNTGGAPFLKLHHR